VRLIFVSTNLDFFFPERFIHKKEVMASRIVAKDIITLRGSAAIVSEFFGMLFYLIHQLDLSLSLSLSLSLLSLSLCIYVI
jgi:hypothetical protein